MATRIERNVLASTVWRVVGCVAVIGGHGMPERAPCRPDANGFDQNQRTIVLQVEYMIVNTDTYEPETVCGGMTGNKNKILNG